MKRTVENDEFLKKRKLRQKKIRKRRIITGLVFSLILLLAVGIGLSLTVFFPIENLMAKGSEKYTSEQIIVASGIKKGDNLFVSNISLETLRKRLPFIEKLEIKKELPNKLEIVVKDAAEYACYSVNEKYYTVSKAGYVLEEYSEKPQNVFEIRAEKVKCKKGYEVVLSSVRQKELINEISSLADEYGLQLNIIDITDEINLSVNVENRFEVSLGTANSLSNKFAHLRGMIKNIDKDKTGKINLSMWTSENTEGTFVEDRSE